MTDESARKVAECYEQKQMVLEKFRGRACYSHFVQAAEFFVRSETGIAGVEDLRFHSSARAGGSTWRIRFAQADSRRIHEARVCRCVNGSTWLPPSPTTPDPAAMVPSMRPGKNVSSPLSRSVRAAAW